MLYITGVADRAVAGARVMADHAVLLRADALDRALGAEVEVVGAQADDLAVRASSNACVSRSSLHVVFTCVR